jgi:hypothetical protein
MTLNTWDLIIEERAVTRLRHSKQHVSVTMIMHVKIEELLEAVFSVESNQTRTSMLAESRKTDTCNKLNSPTNNRTISGTAAQMKQLLKVIRDIEEMARYTPASGGESEQWSFIVSTAEENRQNFCKVHNGKNLISALYGTYTVALHELKAVLKASTPLDQSKTPKSAANQEDGFKEARWRKWHSTN